MTYESTQRTGRASYYNGLSRIARRNVAFEDDDAGRAGSSNKTTEGGMKIRIYLCNGEILDFVPPDAAGAQAILSELGKGRIFVEKLLILGSGQSCTVIPTTAISRLDVLTTEPFALAGAFEAVLLEGSEAEEFAQRVASQAAPVAPGEQFDGCFDIVLSGGHHCRFKWKRVLQEQLQFFMNMKRLLDVPLMAFVHPHGGAILINATKVCSISTQPGFTGYPAGALPAVRA